MPVSENPFNPGQILKVYNECVYFNDVLCNTQVADHTVLINNKQEIEVIRMY